MGSPLPQASQNCDAAWQGAKATALPEGFPPHGRGTQTSLAGLNGERKTQQERGWGGEKVERGDPGREGWFGEGEVLGGLAGEERLVEV